MTFEDYRANVETACQLNPRWRLGQVAFNVLWEVRPDLSEQVRATPLDPFHNRATLQEFYEWVKRHWDDPR